ncbi:MAG: RluA family pseudouridine synthase [Waddliaceae bacterium]
MKKEHLIVEEIDRGKRLDKVLADRYKGIYSRTYFQSLIEEKKVFLNRVHAKKRIFPEVGDQIAFTLPPPQATDLIPEAIPLDILYEDEHIVAVNKPAGMVVHPALGNWSGTFANALVHYCNQISEVGDDALRPGIVHRLDKETSGVIVAAKTKHAHARLIQAFSDRTIKKEYLAVCLGNPGYGVIDKPIGRHQTLRRQMDIRESGGKEAVTRFETLAFDDPLSYVSLFPKTGRTHQLRIHMKNRGTPILGDSLYGKVSSNHKYGAERQMLHAYKLTIVHPVTNKTHTFVAPIPDDISRYKAMIEGRL